MLSTKNVQVNKKTSKTFNPGNHKAKINSINLMPGYNLGSYHIVLNVEGIDMGPDFEGFFIDKDNPSLGRYKGMIGRVRLSQYAFEDGVTPNGVQIYRDNSMLTALKTLAVTLGKGDDLDQVEVNTIEELVEQASKVLSGDKFLNFCFAGREYENKEGYKNYDLYIPRSKNGEYGYEALSASPSKLIKFDPAIHITGQKAAKTVDSFEPESAGTVGDDFDL